MVLQDERQAPSARSLRRRNHDDRLAGVRWGRLRQQTVLLDPGRQVIEYETVHELGKLLIRHGPQLANVAVHRDVVRPRVAAEGAPRPWHPVGCEYPCTVVEQGKVVLFAAVPGA